MTTNTTNRPTTDTVHRTLNRITMPSPIGELTIVATDDAIVAIRWDTSGDAAQPDAHNPVDRHLAADAIVDVERGAVDVLDRARAQLSEYFAGDRTEFELPLAPLGTAFQQQAWTALRVIPFGETISYGEQAASMGDRRKARAVGAANGQNPIPIVVPCHRVVGTNGKLTGFAGGLDTKAWLLDHERKVRWTT
jgi:methylated-DNA-[protein]-cysteine S-methyltransferase